MTYHNQPLAEYQSQTMKKKRPASGIFVVLFIVFGIVVACLFRSCGTSPSDSEQVESHQIEPLAKEDYVLHVDANHVSKAYTIPTKEQTAKMSPITISKWNQSFAQEIDPLMTLKTTQSIAPAQRLEQYIDQMSILVENQLATIRFENNTPRKLLIG